MRPSYTNTRGPRDNARDCPHWGHGVANASFLRASIICTKLWEGLWEKIPLWPVFFTSLTSGTMHRGGVGGDMLPTQDNKKLFSYDDLSLLGPQVYCIDLKIVHHDYTLSPGNYRPARVPRLPQYIRSMNLAGVTST